MVWCMQLIALICRPTPGFAGELCSGVLREKNRYLPPLNSPTDILYYSLCVSLAFPLAGAIKCRAHGLCFEALSFCFAGHCHKQTSGRALHLIALTNQIKSEWCKNVRIPIRAPRVGTLIPLPGISASGMPSVSFAKAEAAGGCSGSLV